MRRRRQLAKALSLATVYGVRRRLARPAWPPIRATRPTPARARRVRRRPPNRRPARRRSRRRRTTCPGGTARRGCSVTPPSQPLPGVKLDCASYDADLDPINGATGTVSIGVVRATGPQTPDDAGPLVMTTGTDLPSSAQLPVWLSRAGADVLKTHPIVAVDRRGIGDVRRAGVPRPLRPPGDARPGAVPVRRRPRRQPRRRHADRHHQLHRHHRARRLRLRQCARRGGHRTAAQHLGRAHPRAARRRQRRPGRAGLRRIAPKQGGPAGARLPAAAGHRRRGRDGATRQGRTGRARRLGRAVRRHQLPARARSQGRDRRAAGGRAERQRAGRRVGGDRRRRRSRPRWPTPAATASTPATTSRQPWRRPAPATPTR